MTDKVEYSFPDELEEKVKQAESKVEGEINQESEVEVIDDTPEKDRGRKPLDKEVSDPTEDELKEYSDSVRERINKLTHARHDERRAKEAIEREREEAVRIAQAAIEENKRLHQRIAKGENSYVSQSQKLAEIELNKAKAELRSAHESGDVDAFVEAQQALNQAQMNLEKVKSFKPTPLQEDKESGNVPPQQVQQPPVPKVDAKAELWKERNSWFGENEEMTSLALGLHNKLTRQGYDLQSDRYYDTIDAEMRKRFPEAFEEEKPKSSAKPPATVVAPSSRATSAKKIKLTQSQVQIAKRLGVPLEIYARKMAELEQQNG